MILLWKSKEMRESKKTYQKGLFSESLAGFYLNMKGYSVLNKRFKTPLGEIDLVVKRGKTLVFVEVKARKTDADEILTSKQLARISKAAEYYLAKHQKYANYEMRFDFIKIILPFGIKHIKSAWITN